MKTTLVKYSILFTICSCLLPKAASAQTTFWTATGSVKDVLCPGIPCTNALGQITVRGIVHTERMQASDPRLTCQVLVTSDGAYNADGSANLQGTSHLVVGTWSGTNFTPLGGVWETTWRGILQPDYKSSYSIAGYGVGGAIDGQRLEATLTVTNSTGLWDGTYLFAGTIKPAPLITTNELAINGYGATWPPGHVIASYNATSRQLTFGGNWNSPSVGWLDTDAGVGWALPWSVPNGQTLETQVDLVDRSPTVTQVSLDLFASNTQGYSFGKENGCIGIAKFNFSALTILYAEKVSLPSTNVVLVLALTRVDPNLIITGKVLDRQSGAVLKEVTAIDTPAADPSLTAAEFAQITGLREYPEIGADVASAPWTTGANGPAIDVFEDTDGTLPPATVTLANLQVRKYEVPQVSIARAVQLSWAGGTGVTYAVEAAPTVQGPWLPVQTQELPGIQMLTVPMNSPTHFFRTVPAP